MITLSNVDELRAKFLNFEQKMFWKLCEKSLGILINIEQLKVPVNSD